MMRSQPQRWTLAMALAGLWLAVGGAQAAQPELPGTGPSRAGDMADFFSQIGDKIYEDCIFELSDEQIEVQEALVAAYVNLGATGSAARRLAANQIQPPPLSKKCEQVRQQGKVPLPNWSTSTSDPKPAQPEYKPEQPSRPLAPQPSAPLSEKKVLAQWDCSPGVDFVTIHHKGYERRLTDGEICNPFEDVVRQVPDTPKTFRLGYTITTGRLYVLSDDPQVSGRTIAWAISGREACRNNPDPDCLAARAVGPLPPGEYAFSNKREERVSWGPSSRRMVAGIYLTKLWYRERYNPAQVSAILARGNIAIHVRLKGEMSEACLGLGPNGWAYVSGLIRDGRATGVNVYIDEPYPQVAERPPIVKSNGFSLTALFK